VHHPFTKESALLTRLATVTAAVGLHARPAAAFVRAAARTGLPITITRPGEPAVDARSLLAVMAADFGPGCRVELAVDPASAENDADAAAALDSLVAVLATAGDDAEAQ
jgi:phosphocarrier protein HPr